VHENPRDEVKLLFALYRAERHAAVGVEYGR